METAKKQEKIDKKNKKEIKQKEVKLKKIEKCKLALEKAEKDLASPSTNPANKPMTSKASNIMDTPNDAESDSESDFEPELNDNKMCMKCKKKFGSCPGHHQANWRGCEECNRWSCDRCVPNHVKKNAVYYCAECLGKLMKKNS